jgi:hypothetical protein
MENDDASSVLYFCCWLCGKEHMVDRFSSRRNVPSNLSFLFLKDGFALWHNLQVILQPWNWISFAFKWSSTYHTMSKPEILASKESTMYAVNMSPLLLCGSVQLTWPFPSPTEHALP